MKKLVLFLIIMAATFFTLKSNAQNYTNSLGLRISSAAPFINHSVTYKHFITKSSALEAMFTFGDPIAFGLLYEKHKPLQAEGLSWFYAYGGYIGFPKKPIAYPTGYDRSIAIGVKGGIGLDYKFAGAPINLSLDFLPELNIIENINFEPAAIGLSIRYVFR